MGRNIRFLDQNDDAGPAGIDARRIYLLALEILRTFNADGGDLYSLSCKLSWPNSLFAYAASMEVLLFSLLSSPPFFFTQQQGPKLPCVCLQIETTNTLKKRKKKLCIRLSVCPRALEQKITQLPSSVEEKLA